MKKRLFAALAFASLAPAALAASPWDGTWKLDPGKSQFAGTTFTYSKTASGAWHFGDGSVGYDFKLDGEPVATYSPEATAAITSSGDHAWTIVFALKGKELSRTHEELSSDGKTLTDHTTGKRPDGSALDSTTVMQRVGAGSGFAGTWKTTKVEGAAGIYKITVGNDGTIQWDIPDYKESFQGKPDGSEHPVTGDAAASGLTLSLKQTSPRSMDYVVKASGKVLQKGTMTVAGDGKTLTDEGWTPGKESEKTKGFYVKQ